MKAMHQAISDVMNKMFFLPVQIKVKGPVLREWFSNRFPLVGVAVSLTGKPLTGFSYTLIPQKTAREMTANFLGMADMDITAKQETDTVKEALNMITGTMLSEFDGSGVVRMGIPQLINEGDLSAVKLDRFDKRAIYIETEHSRMAAGIVLKQA
jgi:CheY-specific phosphatase CheX